MVEDAIAERHVGMATTMKYADYITFCAKRGEEPEGPVSRKFVVRAAPEIHSHVAVAAAGRGLDEPVDRACTGAGYGNGVGLAKPFRRSLATSLAFVIACCGRRHANHKPSFQNSHRDCKFNFWYSR